MTCELDFDTLLHRVNQVGRILDPLRGGKGRRLACKSVPSSNCITLVTFSGPDSVTELAGQWRFTTHVPLMHGSYQERWCPVNEKRKRYYLERAYLHLYLTTQMEGEATEKEILALHCDPNEADEPPDWTGVKHSKYKRGPHLHISTAEDPIPHSHFALNACHLESVLSSVESLTKAMGYAVQMLEDQVLRLYEA